MIAPQMAAQPIFLFSLPRSGSTLVQRVIAAHPDVHTVSEPWVLLPLLYSLRRSGSRAEYWHETAAEAIEDFCRELPGGEDEYRAALAEMVLGLYGRVAGEHRYFLDKTPHYHVIADELIRLFPEGRFVFLWRNPLAVLASCLDTFRDGRWQPHYHRHDLEQGVENLVGAYRRHSERCLAVRFEDLVGDGRDVEWRRVFGYLDLAYDENTLVSFRDVQLRGRYGDPTGTRRYSSITDQPLAKWTETLAGPVRTAWARRYLRRVGSEGLATMGYERAALEQELGGLGGSLSGAARDAAYMTWALADQSRRDRALRISETPQPVGGAFSPPPRRYRRVLGRARRAVLAPRAQA